MQRSPSLITNQSCDFVPLGVEKDKGWNTTDLITLGKMLMLRAADIDLDHFDAFLGIVALLLDARHDRDHLAADRTIRRDEFDHPRACLCIGDLRVCGVLDSLAERVGTRQITRSGRRGCCRGLEHTKHDVDPDSRKQSACASLDPR